MGTGNAATDNCVWNGAQGNVAAQVGFTASANKAVNPLYANRAAKDFQLQSGSPCAGYGPDVTTTPAANPPPPPPAPATVSPPANTQAPTVFGTARSGERLTASSGAWSGTPTFTYSWQRCDRNGGACAATSTTGPVLTLTNADVGYTLRVVVRAQNSAGGASATSAQSSVVQAKKGRKGAVRTFKSYRLQSRRALHRLARTVHR